MPAPATHGAEVERLAELLRSSRTAVALTGAGISVPSGIPDFRTPGTGLWEHEDPMRVAHIDAFRRDPVRFWRFYGERFASLHDKQPNAAHHALAALEAAGRLRGVITQNVDLLHRRAGTRELVEVHGSIASSSCPVCSRTIELERTRELIAQEPTGVPRCPACNSPLRPDVTLFGEMLPISALVRAQELCTEADLVICIGTSLEVHPVAALPELSLARGGRLAIITQSDTPLDAEADVRLRGDVVSELAALLDALGDGDA